MLVPAMAFAWWIVSMSPHGHPPRTQDDASPTEPATAGDDADATDETSGERVRLKVVTPAIVRAARTYLDLPMGTARAEAIDGRRYVFVLERHYHPPGFVGGPHGWHKGVTVYEMR
jgi:hypothetical protein